MLVKGATETNGQKLTDDIFQYLIYMLLFKYQIKLISIDQNMYKWLLNRRTRIIWTLFASPVAFVTKEVNSRLTKSPLIFKSRLANRG